MNEKKTCKECKQEKELCCFELFKSKAKKYYRRTCKTCKYRITYKALKNNPSRYEHHLSLRKKKRLDINKRPQTILKDTRSFDHTKKLENDLDVDFIKDIIKNGCEYCGDKDSLIGLDRIDNTIGHLKNNVKPCCTRCNFLRRNMPFAAWLVITTVLPQIRKQGLFGDWTGRFFKTHQTKNNWKGLF